MEEVERICSRIIILDKGRVIASGTKEVLKEMITLGEKITVEVNALNDTQLGALKGLPNLLSVSLSDSRLVIKSLKGKNNLENILFLLKEQNIGFGKIYSELPTLNDVFLEITGKELRD